MLTWKPKNSQGTCAYCMIDVGRKNVKLCVRCRMVRYCSKECQKKAWPTHKRVCSSELRENLAKDPAQEVINDALSKWIHYWRETLHQWSLWALELPNHPKDRLSTHCFALQLEKRVNPPSGPGQFFSMVGGDVLTRAEVIQILIDTKTSQPHVDQWTNDCRGDNTVQIVIVCEGFFRFLWFSLRDTERMRQSATPDIARALSEDWDDALTAIIESGDASKTRQHLINTVSKFMPPLPN